MTHVRQAAVAGMFYPADAGELHDVVTGLLAEAEARVAPGPVPKAIIAPHAGYVYSGPIAASAYARLKPAADRIWRVVLLGPCHRVAVRGIALPTAHAFATPLGLVPVDRDAITELLCLPPVSVFDDTHRDEHALEVHLPFLQTVLGTFSLVPLVVGQAPADDVAMVLERLWGGDETVIVVSSDLSHYLDYDSARKIDSSTCRAIERLDPSAIGYEQACGRLPVAGLLTVARRRGMQVTTLDLRNSGDTSGDRRRVVGYGAWLFVLPAAAGRRGDSAGDVPTHGSDMTTRWLLDRHGATLLHLAASSIDHALRYGRPIDVSVADYPPDLQGHGASFVTLKSQGGLRGCVGTPQAHRALVEDVAINSYAAAFRDGRFPRLKADERDGLRISVSLLSQPQAIEFLDESDLIESLRPHEDGLLIQSNKSRALFLPQVWATLPEPRRFLAQLKHKAGLSRDRAAPDLKAWRFSAHSVSSDTLTDPAALWS